jgi:hypothetical protein
MLTLPIPIAVSVLCALLLGGSLRAWADVRVRWWPLAIISLAIQLALHNPPINQQPWALTWGPLIWVGALGLILACLARNALDAHAWYWRVALLGAASNLLVVCANGGYMPQFTESRIGAARRASTDTGLTLHNTVPANSDSRLMWLADVIPQPSWLPRADVLSIGDVLLAGGIAAWGFQITRTGRRRRGTPSGSNTEFRVCGR